MTESRTDAAAPLSFEQAMAELEEIVGRLEAGEVGLEESIGLYERGAALKRQCDAKLKEAEARIEKLQAGDTGTPSAEPFEQPS